MLDLRLIKWIVICVMSLYLMERRLPFILASLCWPLERPHVRQSFSHSPESWRQYLGQRRAMEERLEKARGADMGVVERMVVFTTIILAVAMPDSIRAFW
jgi:hypothetical protein